MQDNIHTIYYPGHIKTNLISEKPCLLLDMHTFYSKQSNIMSFLGSQTI